MANNNNFDCLVVGAGYAGLSAAATLVSKGIRVGVLEARVRTGGRVQTGTYQGESFDVGGHWVGAQQPRIRKLIEEFGLKTKEQFDEGKHVLQMFGETYTYSGNISSLNSFGDALKEMEQLVACWDKEMKLIPLEDPTQCPRATEFDSITLAQWQDQNVKSPQARTLMNFLLWTIFTVTAEEISYMWWLYYLRQGHGYSVLADIRGGAQQEKIIGGCQQICDRLVEKIGSSNVFLRCPVQEIHQDGSGASAVTPRGTFHAQRIIVTAPPAVCTKIKFSPPLPKERVELHRRYLPGRVIKVYVLYEHNWWRSNGYSGELLTDQEPVTLTYDATTEKIPAFIGFIPAHLAKKWSHKSSEEIRAAIVKQLVSVYGKDAEHPLHIIVRPWVEDEVWSGGAYSGSMGPNTLSVYGSCIRQPVGRIHWAGTETARDWCGYFEGALESADRVAEEVLAAMTRSKL